jgi:hypothetical protein
LGPLRHRVLPLHYPVSDPPSPRSALAAVDPKHPLTANPTVNNARSSAANALASTSGAIRDPVVVWSPLEFSDNSEKFETTSRKSGPRALFCIDKTELK